LNVAVKNDEIIAGLIIYIFSPKMFLVLLEIKSNHP